MSDHITIDPRFCGPPGTANGGVAAGVLATAFRNTPCRIRLQRPVPLAQRLSLVADSCGLTLRDGNQVLATGVASEAPPVPPTPPSLDAARSARQRFVCRHAHPFPGCYVCGLPSHRDGGMFLHPGPITGFGGVACDWLPGTDDAVQTWAALDCPGAMAAMDALGPVTAVLGEITGVQHRAVEAGAPHIVSGRFLEREGRKLRVGTAVHAADGTLCAHAEAVWIIVTQS